MKWEKKQYQLPSSAFIEGPMNTLDDSLRYLFSVVEKRLVLIFDGSWVKKSEKIYEKNRFLLANIVNIQFNVVNLFKELSTPRWLLALNCFWISIWF